MDDIKKYVNKVFESGHISKRGEKVLRFMLENGSISTLDIEKMGYKHAPRAIRDVREAGIPIITKTVSVSGKRYANYVFGHASDIKENMLQGRVTFPKSFKEELLKIQGNRCAICNQKFESQYLQIDHRVPYEYNGDSKKLDTKDYMLLCAECNRIKDRATKIGCSKTCFKTHDIKIIRSCYWASPENYTHICMKPIRKLSITWLSNSEVKIFDSMKDKSEKLNISPQEYIKGLILKDIEKENYEKY